MASLLIVDDQSSVRELLSEELSKEGYRVTGVGDVESVWKYFMASRPDLVILDLYLDGFEGWDVLEGIKSVVPSLPVLILTAYDSFTKDPRLSQADGYVIKSFVALEELKQKIAHLLRRNRIHQTDRHPYPMQPSVTGP